MDRLGVEGGSLRRVCYCGAPCQASELEVHVVESESAGGVSLKYCKQLYNSNVFVQLLLLKMVIEESFEEPL